MTEIETIPSISTGTVTCKATVTALCPTDQHRDYYDVEITYEPKTRVIELESLRKYLDKYHALVFSQEDLANQIQDHLEDALNALPVTVKITGRHYGMDYEVVE